ncbi:MFS transporter [Roseomonas sp. HF4]|uniref:MFS transporter n=1 Tax=Roseomonas sp. HF4 TaxID=2562313 RepID=UPI0010C08CDB|nr:MFS transporter [Roseomonas sp. HF4]
MSLHYQAERHLRLPRAGEAGAAGNRARRGEFAEGWRALVGAFLVNMVGFGAIYSYAAFSDDFVAAFGASHATSSLVFALSGACCFAVSGVTGPLADRIGPRPLAIVGMVAVALGLMSAAFARSMTEVVLCYGVLIGIGTGFAHVPAMVAIQRCFVVGRGLASGIAAGGVGVGTALVPPMANLLADYGDWRFAFGFSGLGAGIVGLMGAMLIPGMPQRRGASGLREAAEEIAGHAPDKSPGAGAPENDGFAALYLGVLLVSITVALPFAHLVASARSLGFDRADALGLLGVIGIGSIAGRFVLGAVADLVGRRETFLACTMMLVAATMLWSQGTTFVALTAFALLFGLGWGGFVALLPAFVADQFGARRAGTMIGMLYTGRAIALLATPFAAGFAMETLGSHRVPVAVVALLGLAGVILIAFLRRRPSA